MTSTYHRPRVSGEVGIHLTTLTHPTADSDPPVFRSRNSTHTSRHLQIARGGFPRSLAENEVGWTDRMRGYGFVGQSVACVG